ncbi:Hypothetical protein, putative [Bodo saltans]|uniref:Uncharacterized protein n=1 Tax=Bodo saltans TaxID=75058 RepID=A0A0S4JHH6_BODSA|nr:Hypothetical protein, putative [Bodo saltans]|eukprot:CUG89806.1 Hypothetical protein, putative [Bodo saltans]
MTDPFLSADPEALRNEIRRLKQENRTMQNEVALLKARAASASAATSSTGNNNNDAASGAAKALKTTGSKKTDDSAAEVARLKDEVNKLKKEVHTLHSERDEAVGSKTHCEELLEAVGVAACEREQRLRVVAAQIQGELEEVKGSLLAEQQRSAELTKRASTVLPSAPQQQQQQQVVVQKQVIVQQGPPPEEVRKMLETLRRAMSNLEATCLGESLSDHIDEDQRTTRSTPINRRATTNLPTGADSRGSTSTVGTTPAATTTVGEAVTKKRGRPAKGSIQDAAAAGATTTTADAQSERGSTSTKGGRRTEAANEKKAMTLQENIAARTAAAAAVESRRRNAASTSSSTHPTGGGGGSISFSEQPFEDAYTLLAGVPPTRRQQSLETLSRQLVHHFHKDHVVMSQQLVAYIASSAPKWLSTTLHHHNNNHHDETEGTAGGPQHMMDDVCALVREVERRAAMYFDLMDRCGGDTLVLLWARDTIARLVDVIKAADSAADIDQSSQIAPLTTVVRVLSECRAKKQLHESGSVVGGVVPSSQLPTTALYLCVVHYLQSARRHPDRRLIDGSWDAESTRHPLVSAALHLFCSGATTLPAVATSASSDDEHDSESEGLHGALDLADWSTSTSPTRPKPTLLSTVLQGVLMELFVRHHVSVHITRVICSAAGWSCRRLPIDALTAVCVRAAVSAAATSSSPQPLDAIYSLRLLVAFGGLPVLDSVTKLLGDSQKRNGSTNNRNSTAVDNALAFLLSFVVVDFGVIDQRDEEWKRMATYLQDYLALQQTQRVQQRPSAANGSAKGGRQQQQDATSGSTLVGIEAVHAAVSLLYMSTTESPFTSGPTTPMLGSKRTDDSASTESMALEQCWSCAAKWWQEVEKSAKRATAVGGGTTEKNVALLNRLEELFSTLSNSL